MKRIPMSPVVVLVTIGLIGAAWAVADSPDAPGSQVPIRPGPAISDRPATPPLANPVRTSPARAGSATPTRPVPEPASPSGFAGPRGADNGPKMTDPAGNSGNKNRSRGAASSMNKGNDGASATTRQPVRNGSDLAVATYEVSDQTQEKEKPVVQTQRYLQIQNNTGQPLKVFVQVRTQTDQGGWAWFPADPGSSKRAFSLNIEPGKKLYLSSEGSPISASRVRIWAVAGPLQWAQYKAQDLWLVPEVDENGKHHYFAPDMKTFTFIFGAKR